MEMEQEYEGLESMKQQIIDKWNNKDYLGVIESINLYHLISGNQPTAQTAEGELEKTLT